MATSFAGTGAENTALDAPTERALALYDERLRATLEREHLGKVVAIHPDSGDYVVAADSQQAMRALRQQQPHGQMMITRIGPPTASDLRLVERLEAGTKPAK